MEPLKENRRGYRIALLPVLAALLCGARFWQQGAWSVWSKASLHVYVPDPDLGWRQFEDGIPWLGLDSILVMLLCALACVAVLRLFRHREGAWYLWLTGAAAATILVPIWVFVTGAIPAGSRITLPGLSPTVDLATIAAHLPAAPKGRYVVLDHGENSVVVGLRAGGEAFDARWVGPIHGAMTLDPAALDEPVTARFSVESKEVRTDLEDRDEHIRGYLKSSDFPEIALQLQSLRGTRSDTVNTVHFEGTGRLDLMGRPTPVSLSGILRIAPESMRARFGIDARHVLLLKATAKLDFRETAIEDPEDLFDDFQAIVNVTLFLKHDE